MTIAHTDTDLKIQSAFLCVLTEGFDYPTAQDAYEAYRVAANVAIKNPEKKISDMGISLSGRLLPSHLKTCAELVDSVDYLVSTISLGVEYFLDLAQGKHSLLTDPESLIELDGDVFRIHETKLSLMSIETPLERRIPVTDLETQKIYGWTIDGVLDVINRDRSPDWSDYTETDWVEGWKEWVVPEGYYQIQEEDLRPDYFTDNSSELSDEKVFTRIKSVQKEPNGTLMAGDVYDAIHDDMKAVIDGPYLIKANGALVTDTELEEVCLTLYFGEKYSQSIMINFDEIYNGVFHDDTTISFYSGSLSERLTLTVEKMQVGVKASGNILSIGEVHYNVFDATGEYGAENALEAMKALGKPMLSAEQLYSSLKELCSETKGQFQIMEARI